MLQKKIIGLALLLSLFVQQETENSEFVNRTFKEHSSLKFLLILRPTI